MNRAIGPFLIRLNSLFERTAVFAILWTSAALLFIPLVTTRDTLFFYVFGKITFFQVGVEIIVALWVILAMIKKKYRPPLAHPLVASLLAFLLILIVTALIGIDPVRSFWSTQERSTGIIALVHLMAWFLALISTLKEWREWRLLLRAALIANALVGLYGIGQRLGIHLLLPDLSSIRLASTLGNPIYLGVYALLAIGMLLFLLSREKNNLWKLAYVVSALFNAYLMLQSATRGVTLALIAVLFAFGVSATLMVQHAVWRMRIKKAMIATVAVIIISIALLYSPVGKVWSADHLPSWFAERLLYHPFDDPGRIALLNAGWKAFLDRPWTGWGWDNFNYANDQYIHASAVTIDNPWNDRSHNQVLDILVMGGVFGALAYLLMWAILLSALVKKMRSKQKFGEKMPLLAVFFLFVAYFLQNLTVFDTPAPLLIFYLLLGLAYFLINEKPEFQMLSPEEGYERKRAREEERAERERPFPLWGFPLAVGVFAICAFAVWNINIVHFEASKQGIRLLFSMGRIATVEPIIDAFTSLFSSNSFTNYEFREHLSEAFGSIAQSPHISLEKKEKLLNFIIQESEKSAADHPHDLRVMMRLFLLYRSLPNGGTAANEKAKKLIENATKEYPYRYDLQKNRAEFAFALGDTQEGLRFAEKASELDRGRPRSLWFLAVAYAQVGDTKKALETVWQAMKDDDRVTAYAEYIVQLAQSIRQPIPPTALEFFATLAAAYGADDQRFIFARNSIYARAQSEKMR